MSARYYGPVGVAVNLDGERFADESNGTGEEGLNQRLARQPRGLGFYIFDQRLLDYRPVQGYEITTRTILDRARSMTHRSSSRTRSMRLSRAWVATACRGHACGMCSMISTEPSSMTAPRS